MRLIPRRSGAGPSGRPHLRRLGALTVALLTLAAAGAGYAGGDTPAVAGGSSTAGNHADHGYVLSPEQEAAALELQLAPVRGSEFRADCASKGRALDDPIVRPGQPGASHMHEFFGNRSADAYSTLQSLSLGTTNCNPQVDLSAYWVPTLYKNGVPVAPEHVTFYYQGITDRANVKPHPRGLKIVVGNALATSPDQNPAARWSCRGYPESSRDFLSCPAGSKLETYLDFPTCWDGVNLDSPDHKSHMAFGLGGVGGYCPASHPVPVPRLEFLITYPVNGGGLSLGGTRNGTNVTNAPGYTFHGDFFNAWDAAELQRRVTNCIVAGYICGNDGNPIQQ
ncbi:DUF1996 domain-containing protein [Micromonospora echinofusca]|uniref:DUF1996 domain-containing protein n=1 Tax=Micromonospora echinofusca TaxID=47858 RepID=A0ABS3VQU5_MICEH|nr:DUF1996 domain-containing protein [Micromonospora echinofusca]MBO4206905.1 DUF1996 domain-containing protein [Micromonospora echinofusca]